ncbi:hypothetical protein BG011_004649 [Mortierella polycephala]|uniref:Methyltransferase domain-containing protein n=1 Tax=Mortierella polycephala TaxID=41804 RepID=A0A9P6PXQ3_9FUNG|nr:hypothetical protein BG011_004649 [Mortierella polycephala]
MGNVSSADHDKVNELLTRRAKKKVGIIIDRKLRHQSKPSDASSCPTSASGGSGGGVLENGRPGSFFIHRQKSSTAPSKGSRPLISDKPPSRLQPASQSEFYARATAEYSPLTPTSPTASFSLSSANNSLHDPYAAFNSSSMQEQLPTPINSAPIIIPSQHTDKQHGASGPIIPPIQHDSEHHAHYRQQQQQLSADLRLLGTSPEAKDWLKQKPTRSTSHMIHQYNFHTHQYYQPPGSVKIVNNTCRNMTGYAHVPPVLRTSSTAISVNGNGMQQVEVTLPPASSKPRPNSITAAAAALASIVMEESNHNHFQDGMIPKPPSGPTQDHFDGHFNGHGHGLSTMETLPRPVVRKEPRVGRLVMSRSKLKSPSVSSMSSVVSTSSGSAPGSPKDGLAPDSFSRMPAVAKTEEKSNSLPDSRLQSRCVRPSSTLSSLRSLLVNHPQGLSLIESLEDEEDDAPDSLSDTETGDSDADLKQRTQSIGSTDAPVENGYMERKKRPPARFEWMTERKRFSASTLSTISINIHDSQKGQHALWKYIGGGNAHAPLRYDIDRILDSGCGLGEWTMEMAKEFPNATVYGVDINPDLFPKTSQPVPSNCLFTKANILNRLSFPDCYFDFVYQRFLYLGLTVDDWPVALKELRRVMKPGAWIELFEPCMRVHRAGHRTREVMRWISRLLQEERGLDFDFAGEKMKQLCESDDIGFQNVRLERLSIPVGAWGGRVGEAMAENMILMFQNLQFALLENEYQPRDGPAMRAFENMVQSWIRECEDNKSYIDYFILVGQRAP